MTPKMNQILKEALERVKPSEKEIDAIGDSLEEFLKKLERKIKALKIDAEVFVGGSFAKNTVIKKYKYDVDVFIRFDKKYKSKNISKLTGKIVKVFKNCSVVHGSRDYFRIKITPSLFFELVPVIKVKTPKESENITDLSYSHVRYINRKIKSKKILDDIRIAKAFCYGNDCYGAESYVKGFSGYGLELLVYYYGSLEKFIKAIAKSKSSEKIVIDIEKSHKNKQSVLMDLNGSKLQSPIILIDPTFKYRNVLAALSYEAFEKFKKVCQDFLKNPSIKFFEPEKIDFENVEKDAKKNKFEFSLLEITTDKQEGDIAGSKLLKFYNHLDSEISRFFDVKKKGFEYDEGKSAKCFFVAKNKKEILVRGPDVKDKKNVKRFKVKHKKTFVRRKKIYAKEKIEFSLKEFLENWKEKNKNKIQEMDISKLDILHQ